MIREYVDKKSGAILFKKDPDSLRYEELLLLVKKHEELIPKLTKRITALEKQLKSK